MERRSDNDFAPPTVERVLSVIEALADAPQGLSLGALRERVGLPKSVTHRLLSGLIARGFAHQRPNRDYCLALGFVTLGFRFLAATRITDLCQPILDQLAAEVGELVRMTVVDGDRLVWIAKAQGARGSVVVDPVMGRDVVLHATGTGKVWLASLPVEQALVLVLRRGFGSPQEHGPNVIRSAKALLKELELTRQRGYGMAFEEADPGVAAIALPILAGPAPDEPVVGTVSVAGPILRVTRERLIEFLPALRKAAAELAGIEPLLRYSFPRTRAGTRSGPA